MTEFLSLINTNRIDKAFFLWERHQDEIGCFLNDNNIKKILQCIPSSLPSIHLMKWFEESFIPNVYHNSNENLEIIAKWLIERVHMMEITENSTWPLNGITLLKTLPTTCDNLSKIYNKGGFGISTKLHFHILQQKIVDPTSSIHHLINLIDDLQKIYNLKMQYRCYISLSEFLSEDKENVVFLILDRLLGEETIKKAINDFLYPYMKENCLEEAIFVKYIQDVLQFSQFSWWYWEEAPWEEKIISIITCIQNEDCKLDAIIRTLSQAPLPWSLGIQKIYEEGLSTSCYRNKELKIQKQLVQLKTVLIKYELRNYNFNEPHGAQRLVNYILSLDRSSAMDDALEVVKSYDHLCDIDAYLFRLKFLLKRQRHDEFSDLLTSIPLKKAITCGCRLICFIEVILESTDLWNDEEGKTFLINMKLGALYTLKYLQRINPDKYNYYQEELHWFENSYYIQLEFGLSVSFLNLKSEECCSKCLYQEIDKYFSDRTYFENFSVDDRKGEKQKATFSSIFRMGELLGFEKHQTLQKLVFKAVEVHEVDTAFDLISMLTDVCNVQSANTIFETLEHFCRNMETIAKASNKVSELPVVLHSLFSQLMAYCKPNLLEKCLDYCHWTSLLVSLHSLTMPHDLEKMSGKTDRYYQWKFSPLYQDRGLRILPSQMTPFIQRCLMFHISSKAKNGKNLDDENTVNSIKEYFYNGKLLIGALRGKCQGEATLKAMIKLLVAFLDVYANAEMLHKMELNQFIQMYQSSSMLDVVKVLLHYILSSQTTDLAFALGVICIVPVKEALFIFKELMKMSENDIKSLLSITSLGVSYAQINCLTDIMIKFQNYHTQALWKFKLHECNIRFDSAWLSACHTEKRLLLNELVQKCQITKDTIQEYCTTFNLLLDDVIIAYIEETFLKSNIYELYENDFTLSKKGKELFSHTEVIIGMAENPIALLDKLIILVNKVDFYCYEVLLFLKNNICNLSNVHEGIIKCNIVDDIEVLNFLQSYHRISKATEYETNLWLSLHPQCDKLPEIAKKRLPYHPLMTPEKAWNIIDNELSIATVNMWLSVSSLIQVPKDDIIVVALQKTVSTWSKNHENVLITKWNHRPPDYKFLSDMEILNQIDNLDKAIACFNWIIKTLPAGQTRISAAKLFIKYAENWMESCKDKCLLKSPIHKLNIIYHKLAMEDILHTYGLSKTEYATLSSKPTELITTMWEDIENHNAFNNKSKVIHQASKKIAELNKCDLSSIYSDLMNRFLIPTTFGSQSADESFSFDILDFCDDEDKDEINLLKVIHLLHQGNIEDNTIHLLTIGLKVTLSNNSYRARALRCLFSIVDTNTIAKMSGYKSEDLWKLLKVLYCLAELENLHIPYTADSFEKMDKVELVEAILTFSGYSSKALQFASSLCLEYKLWNKQLWSAILRNMRESNMYEELRKLLRLLGNVAHLWYNEDYIEAWKYLIFYQFKYDNFNRENEDKLLDVFTMILRCPCISAIDLEALSEEFRLHKLVVPALAVLLFEKGYKAKEIKKFLKIVSIEDIQDELKHLKNKGFNMAYFVQVYQFLNYKEVN
ncbi:kinetochore-associated protein 1-like [Centruroides sculpturatus]|uniref:kinetochore-associated protein 1-like n=1 Tax=Centruroides sculpturatus TaxID=218467 RepID=UPI000C6EE8BA|nr:kinetochore-associated protein 1-like [Centruroides sculpturatus]